MISDSLTLKRKTTKYSKNSQRARRLSLWP